tara:strand:+ start:264 stop:1718 length:1455 start_codon:yes stop_codon:yes gene_type:complete
MSEIKVNKISPRTACGTTTLGDSGDTFTIPSGVTITNNGTANGFGATGAVNWQTTVKTGNFTATAGEGYFLNTTSGQITVNLPAGTAGAVVGFKDYAGTFDTNKATLNLNGSDKLGGLTVNASLTTEGQAVTLVFVDSTQGWLVTDSGLQSDASQAEYIAATGGNTTITCGDNKIHIFTGPGTLCVSNVGNPQGSDKVEYLVVAGGGGGAGANTPGCGGRGGGGGGGWRSFTALPNSGLTPCNGGPGASLNAPVGIAVTPGAMPVVVGGGGAAGAAATAPSGHASRGTPSVFGPITSTGGGGGSSYPNPAPSPNNPASPGGSGGGAYGGCAQGAGNTPPVSPPQGNSATAQPPSHGGSGTGGGGAGASPFPAAVQSPPHTGTNGGVGSNIPSNFIGPTAPSYGQTPSPLAANGRYFSGGGGGGSYCNGTAGSGGAGGGASGAKGSNGSAGSVNTGGGGGGTGSGPYAGGAGGSGIVMIRYKFQN